MQRPPSADAMPATYQPGGQPVPLKPAPGQFVQPNQFGPNPFAVASPTAAPPIGQRTLPTVLELVSAFKRRWAVSLMMGVLVAAVAAAGVWFALPSGKHQAQAMIRFKSSTEGVGGKAADGNLDFDRWVAANMKVMQTKNFALQVAQDEKVAAMPLIKESDDPGKEILDLVTLKLENPEHVSITINGNDEEQIKTILQGYVKKYVEVAQEKESESRKRLLGSYREAYKNVEEQIVERNQKLLDILQKNGVNGGSDVITVLMIEQNLKERSTQANKLKDDAATLVTQVKQLKAQMNSPALAPKQADVEDAIRSDPQAQLKLAAYQSAQVRLRDAEQRFDRGSAVVAERETAADNAKRDFEKVAREAEAAARPALVQKVRDALALDLAALEQKADLAKDQAETIRKEVETLTQQRKEMKVAGVQINNEKQDIDPLVEKRNEYSKKLTDLEMLDKNKDVTSRIEVVEGAQLYRNFNFKTKIIAAIVAGLGGLVTVILVIAFLEWRNRRVDGVDQVVSELGLRVIGTIPAFPSRAQLRSGEASQNQNWRFILNESVNSTRTMLLHAARTQQMQVILVTSAMQGEGKTSLSSQLATSMATAGLRTLILDCDLRNPSMQKLFDIPVSPGCSEILLQEIDISDAVQATSVPNLWIIPAGQCNHRVIAALAQGHPLEALFNRLRGQFDIVVVDSCPILPVADTLLVAQHVDGVVFSILQNVSQLPKVQSASDRLVQLNIPLVGAVVNGIKPDIQAYGYNYVKQLPA